MATTTRYYKRKAIFGAVEAVYGTDIVPTAGVEARNVQYTPLNANFVSNNIVRPYYGNTPELPVSQDTKLAFDIAMQGSGTAGVPPAYDFAFRAAGMASIILAAAVSGTLQAATANTITLVATASAVDNAYKGMYINLDGGTGTGQSGVIVSYNGTSKVATMMSAWTTLPDATTTYTIPPQVSYSPVSGNLESSSLYCNFDGVLQKLLGTRGSVKAKMTPKGLPVFTFDTMSLYDTPTDVVLPSTIDLTAFKQPEPVTNDWTSGAQVHGVSTNVYDFAIDLAQKFMHRDDVIGINEIDTTDRAPTGNIVVQAGLMAEMDWYTEARDAVLGPILITQGVTPGLRCRIAVPSAPVKAPKIEDKNGIIAYNMDYEPIPINGNDEVFIIFD